MTLVHSEPTPGQVIRELHCWVATYPDGSEGIIATGLPGIGMTPLMSSRRATAEGLEGLARQMQREARNTSHALLNVRLVTFASTETRQ